MKTFILIILMAGTSDGGRAIREVRGFTQQACAAAAQAVVDGSLRTNRSWPATAVCVDTE
jgi:hypothetical protein